MRCFGYDDAVMRDLALLFIHLLVTISRLFGLGVARSVVAESLVCGEFLILSHKSVRFPSLVQSTFAIRLRDICGSQSCTVMHSTAMLSVDAS